MERKDPQRPHQGGGTGTGFRLPPQILHEEHKHINNIMQHVNELVEQRRFQHNLEIMNASPRLVGAIAQSKQQFLSVHKAMMRRFFLLRQRRKKHFEQRSSGIELSSTLLLTRKPDESGNGISKSRILNASCQHDQQNTNDCFNCFQQAVAVKEKNVKLSAIKPLCKTFIPGLPKGIENAVKIWRFGDMRTRTPLRLFDKVKSRRRIVQSYTESWWRISGQKAAYYKLKKLISLVAEEGMKIKIFEVGEDHIWDAAVEKVHKRWDVNGLPLPFSSFLRQETTVTAVERCRT
ncbi:hypothetical protein FGB62_31g113 [Gracilaria domingensis]|nr:hypothetical protein FGB62_31g113 [Gracilaria domingensis]